MAIITIDQTIPKKAYVQVAVVGVEITGLHFILDRNRAIIALRYIDDGGRTAKREYWVVKGAALSQALGAAPAGTSLLGALRNGLETLVAQVEQTEGLKDSLIATGQIELFNQVSLRFDK